MSNGSGKSLRRFVGLLLVGHSCFWPLIAQETPPLDTVTSFLVRLERLRRDHDSCVLVRGDGEYHVEILYPVEIRILEGTMSPEELRDLQRLLSQDKLFHLQQRDIRTPLLETDIDRFFVSILRPGHWQNLSFPSAESRNSFSDILDPLLKWLDDIQKKKARPVTEQLGRNNCLPPADIQLKQHPGATAAMTINDPSAADQHAASSPKYLFRILTNEIGNDTAEVTCLIVFDSGAYHRVREVEKLGSKVLTTTVVDGSLSHDDLDSLRTILDADKLRNYVSKPLPRHMTGARTVIHLSIPRIEKSQQITVWKYLDTGGWDPGVDDHGTKLVRPLNDWLKTKVSLKNEKSSSEPANPQCLPEP